MKVRFEGERFSVQCSFAEREDPRNAGFKWDPDRREWFTTSARVAARLRRFADKSAEKEISRILLTRLPWSGRLSYPKGVRPDPHQIEAANFALSTNRTYLALKPGLGKTPVAALVRNAHACPSLYICPPFLMTNVEFEFTRWSVGAEITRFPAVPLFNGPKDFWIIPDSMLAREETQKKIRAWADRHREMERRLLLFIDEAHRFKTEGAHRTKALYEGIVPLFDFVHHMSGTPMPNRPMELYPVLSNCAPETIDFMNRFEFGKKYCDGKKVEEECKYCFGISRVCRVCKGEGRLEYGWDFTGASNLDELAKRINGKFMLRMGKEVLKLKPKIEELLVIGDDLKAETAELDRKILRAVSPEDLVQGRISARRGDDEGELPIATYRRELGKEKVKPAVDYLKSILDDGDESVLVFAYHKEVIAGLERGLARYNPIVVTGSTDPKKRKEMVEGLGKDSRLFIGNYLAAGIGLNMTQASRVIFVEFSWVPADNEQASDRSHRRGQTETVFVQYMVFKNSIDRTVMETVFRKQKITEYV